MSSMAAIQGLKCKKANPQCGDWQFIYEDSGIALPEFLLMGGFRHEK